MNIVKIFFVLFAAGFIICGISDTNLMAETKSYTDSTNPVLSATFTGSGNGTMAIMGWANQNSGHSTNGVYGRSDSSGGRGVLGHTSSATGETYGVYGYSSSNSGRGVFGYSPSVTGYTFGVFGQSDSAGGYGVYGYNTAASGSVSGVYGMSESSEGAGVVGYNHSPSGNTYGVFAQVSSPDGYAGYFAGKTRITGDLVLDGNLVMAESMKIPEYTNKSTTATVTASSEYNSNYKKENAIDGIINRWDAGEWASLGEKEEAWIQLTWGAPQKISEVWIYDRPNKYDHIDDAYLLIDNNGDGTADQTLHLGMFPYGGAPKKIYLTASEGTSIYSMKLVITDAKETTLNVGLSEIECYYNPNSW